MSQPSSNDTGSPLPQQEGRLPWDTARTPLMLAPLQGLTNRALRSLFVDWVRPDVVFTEFLRVNNSRKSLARNDLLQVARQTGDVPLVTQLVGSEPRALVDAALRAEAAGTEHLNLNLGCPYGRMTSGATGGALLQQPDRLSELVPALRGAINGSFSIKLRAGYDDPQQIFALLPLFERSGVDFLVLHPRTVIQKYAGIADHAITSRVVKSTSIPVIANGDIRSAAQGLELLASTGAAGLMLGRGAIADPLLFERLRSHQTGEPGRAANAAMLRNYLSSLLQRYSELFCGEKQTLDKFKNILFFIDDAHFSKQINKMKRSSRIDKVLQLIEKLE